MIKEKIKIAWIKEEIKLCVLKKLNWKIWFMILTNIKIENNTDSVKVFSKYSSRWWVEDTYKFIKSLFIWKTSKSLWNFG